MRRPSLLLGQQPRLTGSFLSGRDASALAFESKMTAFMLGEPEARSAVESTIPLARIGEPDDIAGLAIFLASRAGAYLTATVIPLDGGYSGAG
ncbi:SDR family oxidoreductase [Thermoleophilia bacterium SCSIO 60948]|nr:SDR family oxidoreductase [Thermoleophilia bacterium SCSIO 60948]